MRYSLSILLSALGLLLISSASHARDDDFIEDSEGDYYLSSSPQSSPSCSDNDNEDWVDSEPFHNSESKERDRVSSLIQACLKNMLFQQNHTLMLHDQDIFDLPEEESFWKKLATLEDLFIFNNSLQRFPVNIRQLKHLKSLYASNNHLSHLPASLGELTALTHIDFSTNDLQELPDTMKHLTQLTDLVLSGNRFRRLPAFIENFPRLERLEVANNPIDDSKTLAMLDRLKERGVKGLSQQ